MRTIRLGYALWTALALGGAAACVPALHLWRTAQHDHGAIPPPPPGVAVDASRLDPTPVHEIWHVPSDPARAEAELVALVRRAAAQGLPVSIAGARHSQGGHTFTPDGLVVDMLPFRQMHLGFDRSILTVQAGARWSEVVPYLNAHGRSVAIMQSNHDFSVGGTMSVNAHGWQTGRPPFAASVRAFRLLLPSGEIVRCSLAEHADLFRLALGGYGLFGIVLDVELETVPNEWYRMERHTTNVDGYAEAFRRYVANDSTAAMAYGRVSVAPKGYFRDVVLTVYRRATPPGHPPLPDVLPPPSISRLPRLLFRGSVGSRYGKNLRWDLEREALGIVAPDFVVRNALLNEPASGFTTRDTSRTEILHEYFLPPDHLAPFLRLAARILPRYAAADLLNVTIRDVQADTVTVLRYAPGPRLCAVLFFEMPRTAAADSSMARLTRELVDAALDEGGSYYLPYRLHATAAQFHRAYPNAEAFFEAKRRIDPKGVFQNQFYRTYARP